ncbi:MAG: hypothetical protein U9N86_08015 [Bacteroidota bacterium]|nr:hypothetical protein [Bacteroidota bacterium]
MKTYIYILILSLFFVSKGNSQQTPDELLSGLKSRMNLIAGFQADAFINVDVEFINIKEREVKIKFTAPDKFDFDAKGIALMPKNGMKMEYMGLIYGANTAIPVGSEPVRDVQTQIIKVIPESIDSDIILAQLWIDPGTFRIMRMKTFTRESGSYLINFFFKEKDGILPYRLEVSFDIENMGMSARMMNEFMGKNRSTETDSLPHEAKVLVEYRNMVITLK